MTEGGHNLDAPFFPSGTKILGRDRRRNALIGILGRGGVGKSHLVRQLLTDEDYGPDEVGILMAEDATTTYDVDGARITRITGLADLDAKIAEIRNRPAGTRLPLVYVVDSISGLLDYQRRHYKNNPHTTTGGGRDKRSEFGEMGYMGMDALIDLRDSVESDVIALVTTHETPGNLPEFAVEGKLLPKNFVRLTNLTLHMRAEQQTFDPRGETRIVPHPWRTVSNQGIVLDRYFWTMDSGEIQAKGHHNLDLKEPAYLPDILRVIHGKERKYA